MKLCKRAMVIGIALMAVFAVNASYAQEQGDDKSGEAEIQVSKMGTKFCRGIVNCATGWGEIPRQFVLSAEEDGPLLMVPYGIVRGAFMTVARTMTGVIETAFFYVPFNGNYDCFLDPAYVWQKAKGDNNENPK